MKVTTKKTGEYSRHLEVVATPQEVNNALDAAQIEFANSMGLRPQKGKTVSQVAEEKMGIKNLDSVVEHAAMEALVPNALDKKNLVPAYPPQVDPKTPFKRGREFSFVLDVELKPNYELTSYDPVSITVPPFYFDPTAVDAQLKEFAKRYVSYEATTPKAIEAGDSCLLAMQCFENGEELKNLTTDGRTYTAGRGLMPDGFDKEIIGMKPGETKSFTFEGPDVDEEGNEITSTIEATVTVKEIQKAVEPEINDEWVKTNMPMYKDAEALRSDIAKNLERQARDEYESYELQMAAAQLATRFKGSIADEVYESMRTSLMNNLRADLQQQGKSYEEFVQENGGEQSFGMMMMMQTRQLLTQGYALDAIYRHEHLVLTDEDIEAACKAMNPNQPPRQVRQQMEQTGRGFVLRETAERLKANKWVLEHANITYENPNVKNQTSV